MTSDDFMRRVHDRVREVLSPAGFRKKGNYYIADRDDVALVVQLQKSMSSTKNSPILTVNLGVFSRTVATRLGYPTKNITIPVCHWRERIGFLQAAPADRWWAIDSEAAAGAAGAEIASLLRDPGMKILGGLDSTPKLRQTWESGVSPGLTDRQRKDYLAALAKTT